MVMDKAEDKIKYIWTGLDRFDNEIFWIFKDLLHSRFIAQSYKKNSLDQILFLADACS